MFKDGIDQGYQSDPNWWFNPGPYQYRISDLDNDYPAEYFPLAKPPEIAIINIVKYVQEYFERFSGRKIKGLPLKGVVEFGCGGGWTINEFHKLRYGTSAYEGSVHGLNACCELGLDWVVKQDIRQVMQPHNYKYDVAIATEVAEHCEESFAGILAHNLIGHSDFIWWSAAEPGATPHLHHPNEKPHLYWQNIFAFYDYKCFMLPDHVFNACGGRGRAIFYNPNVYQV